MSGVYATCSCNNIKEFLPWKKNKTFKIIVRDMSDDIISLPAGFKNLFLVKLTSRWLQSVSQTTPAVFQVNVA